MTIRLPHILLTVAACLALLPACTGPKVDRAMLRAEAMLDSAPDSAAALLDSVAPLLGRSETRRANHTALTAFARHKADMPLPRRDTLQQAAEHFIINPEPVTPRHVMAFYALGLSCEADSLFTRSLSAFTRAEDAAQALADHHMLGLIYRHMADIYSAIYNCREAVHYGTLSLEQFRMGSPRIFVDYAMLDLASFHNHACDYASSKALADTLMILTEGYDNPYIYTTACKLVACAALAAKNYEETVDAYTKIIERTDTLDDTYSVQNLTEALIATGRIDKAKSYLDRFVPDDSAHAYVRYDYNIAVGNYRAAIDGVNHYLTEQDKVIRRAATQDVTNFIRRTHEKRNAQLQQQVRTNRIAWIAISMAAALAIAVMMLIYRNRTLTQKREIADAIAAMQELSLKFNDTNNQLTEQSGTLSHVNHVMSALLHSRMKSLNSLCESIYEFSTPSQHKKFYSHTITQLANFSGDIDTLRCMISIININYNQAIDKLKTDFPDMKDEDFHLFIYLTLGLTSRTISVLLNTSVDSVYRKKYKLKLLITESPSQHTSLYMTMLGYNKSKE